MCRRHRPSWWLFGSRVGWWLTKLLSLSLSLCLSNEYRVEFGQISLSLALFCGRQWLESAEVEAAEAAAEAAAALVDVIRYRA